MKVTEKDNYIIVEDEKNNVKGFANYLEKHADNVIANKNIVVDILKYGELKLEELLLFLPISNRQRAAKNSFVIANDTINIDEVPAELMVVPTLKEAADVIQMEEIERDLGAF
ncbi:ribonuclease Z [Haloflavibacter putidus]|uniref:Ribonuclease Z n=1 Tax=Haloflavibacter putidus TaxID=2576776 RepID=A0A507ZWI0_9FLAO|nr:ribonuclease Z [Haloflavibacter putidus]TQD40058.1 ribonuclease Z [Haloflavibacter putidus]